MLQPATFLFFPPFIPSFALISFLARARVTLRRRHAASLVSSFRIPLPTALFSVSRVCKSKGRPKNAYLLVYAPVRTRASCALNAGPGKAPATSGWIWDTQFRPKHSHYTWFHSAEQSLSTFAIRNWKTRPAFCLFYLSSVYCGTGHCASAFSCHQRIEFFSSQKRNFKFMHHTQELNLVSFFAPQFSRALGKKSPVHYPTRPRVPGMPGSIWIPIESSAGTSALVATSWPDTEMSPLIIESYRRILTLAANLLRRLIIFSSTPLARVPRCVSHARRLFFVGILLNVFISRPMRTGAHCWKCDSPLHRTRVNLEQS